MNPFLSMKKKLEPLGVYSLSGGTFVEAELKAYAAEFGLLLAAAEELKRELFIRTAERFGLTLREAAAGPEREYLPLEARREMLLYRGAVTVNDNRREDIERAMIACGIRSSIHEKTEDQSLYFNCIETLNTFNSQEETKAAAEEFLPAHLSTTFDFGRLDWNFIDAMDKSFQEMDQADNTWNQIDLYQ